MRKTLKIMLFVCAILPAATITMADPVGGRFTGRVTIVDRVFDSSSGTFGVRIELPNPDHSLPAGHRCTVTFEKG